MFPVYSALTISILALFIVESVLPLAGVYVPWWAFIIIFVGLFVGVFLLARFIYVPHVLPRYYHLIEP